MEIHQDAKQAAKKVQGTAGKTSGFFHLKENGTNVSTEIIAGLTTFLQCHILFL